MMDLSAVVSGEYRIKVKSIEQYMEGFILSTSQGGKYLRKHNLSSSRINFIHGVKEHISNNGFYTIDRYICTYSGLPYIEYNDSCYTLSDIINGRECDFAVSVDAKKSAAALAKLHQSFKTFHPPQGSTIRSRLGRLPSSMKKKLQELRRLKNFAMNRRSEFDRLFLDAFDMYYEMGNAAFDSIKDKCYYELISNKEVFHLSHYDIGHKTIILCNDDDVFIKGFENCCNELSIIDLADFLRRRLEKCKWSKAEGENILNEYESIKILCSNEKMVLKALLQFPYRLWKITNRYYNSRKTWAEKSFIPRLNEVVSTIKEHTDYINYL